jgi:chromosome segregation ATPase
MRRGHRLIGTSLQYKVYGSITSSIQFRENTRIYFLDYTTDYPNNPEHKKIIDTLKNELEIFKKTQQEKNQTEVSGLQSTISSKDTTIADLRQQLANIDKMRSEYENVKHQVQHVDTFRNELVKEREQHQKTRNEFENKIKELIDQIEYLQLTPAKRKKVDEARAAAKTETVIAQPEIITATEDGGSF